VPFTGETTEVWPGEKCSPSIHNKLNNQNKPNKTKDRMKKVLITPPAYGTCVRHLRTTPAYDTCVRHLRTTPAYDTCVWHLRTALAYGTFGRRFRTPLVYATCVCTPLPYARHLRTTLKEEAVRLLTFISTKARSDLLLRSWDVTLVVNLEQLVCGFNSWPLLTF